MDIDLLRIQPGDLGRLLKSVGLALGPNPDITSIRKDMSRAGHGFHGRMRQIGQEVLGLDLLVGLAECVLDITITTG